MQNNHITIPLRLEELRVLDCLDTPYFTWVRVAKDSLTAVCPGCHHRSFHVHDRRWQMVKDLWCLGKPVTLRILKRRFRCHPCDRVFLEPFETLHRYARMTTRFMESLWKDPMASFRAVAQRFGIGEGVARRAFIRHAKALVDHYGQEPFAILSIDENSFRKQQRFNMILADVGRQRVVEILPGHSRARLVEWLKAFPYRKLIRFLVIDMCRSFLKAVQEVCPEVMVVADKFHMVRTLNDAVISVKEKCRQRKDRFKWPPQMRWLLVRGREKLRDDQKEVLEKVFTHYPDLAVAYELKEQFRAMYHLKSSLEGQEALMDFVFAAAQSPLPDFQAFSRTCRRWWPSILNWFELPVSNGYTEGTNNRLKTMKRNAYGFRSFEMFRLKGLVNCGKLAS